MKVSQKANNIELSLTRDLFNRAQQYDDVINLTLGDPDLPPPQSVRDAACDAIQKGKTRYSANAGLPGLRKAIAGSFIKEYGLSCDPTREVIVTVGGMEALYLAFSSIVDPGDEVIIFAPYYVNYVQMVRMNGGVPVVVETSGSDGFSVYPETIKSHLSDKTVAIVINSPCNPTGTLISREVLGEIAEMVNERDLYVISDEVYKSLVYDGRRHCSVLEFPNMKERTILIDSLSKKYAMTGWRLGWAIGPEAVIAAMTRMQENVAACASLPSQYGAIEALEEKTEIAYIHRTFAERRNLIYREINACPRLWASKPEATFYIFVNIKETGLKSLDFALKLLDDQHVAVVPGITYGKAYDDYIRIAFTHDADVLLEACRRIHRFMGEL